MMSETKEVWQNKMYNFDEALTRLKVSRQKVEEFKEKARKFKEIPENIQDELVCFLNRNFGSFKV